MIRLYLLHFLKEKQLEKVGKIGLILYPEMQKGALFWAQVRSQKPLPSCDGSIDFAKACFEAQKRLSSFDTRRNSDPEFRSGWNSL